MRWGNLWAKGSPESLGGPRHRGPWALGPGSPGTQGLVSGFTLRAQGAVSEERKVCCRVLTLPKAELGAELRPRDPAAQPPAGRLRGGPRCMEPICRGRVHGPAVLGPEVRLPIWAAPRPPAPPPGHVARLPPSLGLTPSAALSASTDRPALPEPWSVLTVGSGPTSGPRVSVTRGGSSYRSQTWQSRRLSYLPSGFLLWTPAGGRPRRLVLAS